MERPTTPEQPSGDARIPLSFSLHQAAALCRVSSHQLWEWTTCGYVPASGTGRHRRYNHEALRQIITLREALRGCRRSRRARQVDVRYRQVDGSASAQQYPLPPTPDEITLALQWNGPGAREQRIRASRRSRVPSQPS